MARALGLGPATVDGLRWLSKVGAVSLEAWGTAMGWGRSATYRHTARLTRAGWARTQAMGRGSGSLIYATPRGVRATGLQTAFLAAAPAPTTWAHCEACGWTAAWLTARGRRMIGPRELLTDDTWHGRLQWVERGNRRARGHRPDLIGGLGASEPRLPIEVELATKSTARLQATLELYATWIAAGKARAVIYICATDTLAERVRTEAKAAGLSSEAKTLRVELLDTIKTAARTAAATRRGIRHVDRREAAA